MDHEGCEHCGLVCSGTCDDPNRCLACSDWENLGLIPWACEDPSCPCVCHDPDSNASDDEPEDSPARKETREIWGRRENPEMQPGHFDFLKLPYELRNMIYVHNMKQYRGKRNRSLYYEGVIETAILKTCRQINREARHLPLMLNTLNFLNPSDAHHFLGFKILPSQRTLLRALHVNVRGTEDFNGIFSNHLIPQLAELSLNHIGITMQGRIELEWFTEWKWLETCLAQFKGLTSIDLVIGSGIISSAAKRRIAEELKKKILAAPTAPSNPLKRKASQTIPTDETGILTQAGNTPVGLSWSDTISVKTSGREIKANQTPTPKDERSRDVMIVCDLTSKYERLERYARSYDPEVSSVKIRLGKTLEAATEGDEEEFERLAEDVIGTLEAHLANIIASRGLMPWRLSPIRQ